MNSSKISPISITRAIVAFSILSASISVQASAPPLIHPNFKDATLSLGIDFQHRQSSKQLSALDETLGAGVCVFDYNNDGWQDLFLVGGSGQTRFYGKKSWWNKPNGSALYQNVHGRYFEDVTKKAGLTNATWGMGCVAGDLDNDGDNDILITTRNENILYENNGDSTFSNITNSANIIGNNWSTGASLSDVNGDGLLDIYITNFINLKKGTRTFEFNAGFDGNLNTTFNASTYDGVANQLFINQGNLTFTESAQALEIDDPAGRGLGGFWFDANNDKREDLLIINGSGSPSHLYINTKNGFTKSSLEYRIDTPNGVHGASINDLNNDGLLDIVATTASGSVPLALMANTDGQELKDLSWDLNIAQENNLALNGWGVVSADFDNDSWVDLFFANGMSTPDIDTPHIAQAQPNQILMSHQGTTYSPFNINTENLPSRGSISADFDNDGDIDIFVTNNNEMGKLLINNQTTNNKNDHRWIGFDLVSKFGRTAISASVTVELSNKKITRTSRSAQTFLGNSDYRVHIGLGNLPAERLITATVDWKDGDSTTLNNIATNQYIRVDQSSETFHSIRYAQNKNKQENFNLNATFSSLTNDFSLWLTQSPAQPEQAKQLARYFSETSITNQKSIIKALLDFQKTPNKHYISILKSSLESKDTELLRLGIKLAKQYELASSIYWLVKLLNHSSSEVACDTSKTLEYFFREEEAVTHRKYLAVAPLIRILQHKDKDVVVCALNALAESERYRALTPIGELITSDLITNTTQSDVTVAAIQALGRIRDKDANQFLLNIMHHHKHNIQTDAVIIAHTLIALKRLKHPQPEKHIKTHLSVTKNSSDDNLSHAIAVASALILFREDHTVIPPDRVEGFLFQALSYKPILELSKPVLFQTLAALTYTDNKKSTDQLTAAINSTLPSVRLRAYESLINLGGEKALKIAIQGLYDDDLTGGEKISHTVLLKLFKKGISIEASRLTTLINKSSLGVQILALANPQTIPQFAQQLSKFIAQSNNADELRFLYRICYTNPESKISISQFTYEKSKRLQLATNTLKCGISQNFYGINRAQTEVVILNALNAKPEIILENIALLARSKQPWIKKTLLQFVYRPPFHAKHIITYLNSSSHDIRTWKAFLKKSLAMDDNKIRYNTLALIDQYQLKEFTQDIKNILKNSHEYLELRKLAAKTLFSFDRDSTLEYLTSHD